MCSLGRNHPDPLFASNNRAPLCGVGVEPLDDSGPAPESRPPVLGAARRVRVVVLPPQSFCRRRPGEVPASPAVLDRSRGGET
jgi:hypothetical protein